MKNKPIQYLLTSMIFLSYSVLADQAGVTQEELLTGDTKLACEAILCLSSGDRPSECSPSLQRYFSISRHKKLTDTIQARKDFLQICPSSNEQGMPSLINAISQGAGRCDAAELNRVNRKTITVPNPAYQQCVKDRAERFKEQCEKIPKTITKTIIENKRPTYCSAYFNHGWTHDVDAVRYVGEQENDGKWVDQ